MVLVTSMISVSTLGPSRELSGRMRWRAEGALPTNRSTRCQYSGWEVYWSQATTAQRVRSQFWGSRMSAGPKGRPWNRSSMADRLSLLISESLPGQRAALMARSRSPNSS